MKKLLIKITTHSIISFYSISFFIKKAFAISVLIDDIGQVAYGPGLDPNYRRTRLIFFIIQIFIFLLAIFSFIYSIILLSRIIYFKNRLKKIQNDQDLQNVKKILLDKLHVYKKILLVSLLVFIFSIILFCIIVYINNAVAY